MIKYVGIKTEEEVNSINEDFLRRANEHNKKVEARRIIVSIIVLIAMVLIAIQVGIMFVDYWQVVACVLGVISFGTQFAILKRYGKNLMSTEDCDKPVACQFFKATNGRQIVEADFCQQKDSDKVDLRLSVKDVDDNLSVEYIRNFKLVIHQGTKNIVVDINGGVIYQPSIN